MLPTTLHGKSCGMLYSLSRLVRIKILDLKISSHFFIIQTYPQGKYEESLFTLHATGLRYQQQLWPITLFEERYGFTSPTFNTLSLPFSILTLKLMALASFTTAGPSHLGSTFPRVKDNSTCHLIVIPRTSPQTDSFLFEGYWHSWIIVGVFIV